MRDLPPDLPHEFPDDIEDWEDVPFKWIGIVFLGVLLGVAAFIGIVIGALS